MIEIRQLRKGDIGQAAEFIARLNRRPEDHIVYLGTEPDEIQDSLLNDLTDLPAEEAVAVAVEGDRIVGLWGVEMDNSRGRAYMWGPFVEHEPWQETAAKLYDAIEALVPDGTTWFQIAIGSKNVRVHDLAERMGYPKRETNHFNMALSRADYRPANDSMVIELPESARDAFAALHDRHFPNTYYDGAELLGRLSETRRGWITEDNLGYVYVECKPEHGWASLEFVGVDERARGRGYGRALLSKACGWLLGHEKIDTVELSVAGDNRAMSLYKKTGFRIAKEIVVFQKEL